MMIEISQHILDLLENSINAGAFEIHLTIKVDSNQNLLWIIVEDNGSGFPEDPEEILTPFFTTKKEKKTKNEFQASSFKYYYTTALSGGDWHKAKAEVKNGIVTVIIPKTEAARPKKITVKAKESK
jgi:signal transduction histidine kinase